MSVEVCQEAVRSSLQRAVHQDTAAAAAGCSPVSAARRLPTGHPPIAAVVPLMAAGT